MTGNQQKTLNPYPWQKPIVDAVTDSLKTNRYAINASGTGAGKTVMALASARDLIQQGVVSYVLVIAPKVSLTQWFRTAKAMGVEGEKTTHLLDCVNPERVSLGISGFYTEDKGWQLPQKTLVIWDEPHRNASGETSKATLAMARLKTLNSSYLLAMSATLADSPLKLRALGYWAGFHNFLPSDFHRWCRMHGCLYEEMPNGRMALRFTRSKSRAQAYMAEIRKDFGKSYVAIDAKDIPGFPEQTLETLSVNLSARDAGELESAYAEMSERLRTRAKSDLAEIGRCRERIEFSKAATMAELAAGHMSDGKSVVIFCNFTSARERIEERLRRLGVTDIGSIYGGQKEDERQDFIDRFQNNTLHVMIVMTAAGGAALSLHDEKKERPRVSLITPSFNAAEVRQALGRIRRCNGTNVEQYFVLAANTIEDNVAKKLEAKLANIDTLNDNDLEV